MIRQLFLEGILNFSCFFWGLGGIFKPRIPLGILEFQLFF